MEQVSIYSTKIIPSTSYTAFLYGAQQEQGDGSSQVLDISAAANNASIGAGTTYNNVVANDSFLTATSATSSVSGGRGFSLGTTATRLWDMAAGKSLLLAFRLKTPTSAVPAGGGSLLGSSGGGAAGLDMSVGATGRLSLSIRDGTRVYSAPSFSPVNGSVGVCDGIERTVILMIDGTTKKVYTWLDGTILLNGADLSAVTGSTQGTFNLSFGHTGNPSGTGTWDNNASPASPSVKFRAIQYFVMSSFPTNYAQIAAWLSESNNIFRVVSKNLLA